MKTIVLAALTVLLMGAAAARAQSYGYERAPANGAAYSHTHGNGQHSQMEGGG